MALDDGTLHGIAAKSGTSRIRGRSKDQTSLNCKPRKLLNKDHLLYKTSTTLLTLLAGRVERNPTGAPGARGGTPQAKSYEVDGVAIKKQPPPRLGPHASPLYRCGSLSRWAQGLSTRRFELCGDRRYEETAIANTMDRKL